MQENESFAQYSSCSFRARGLTLLWHLVACRYGPSDSIVCPPRTSLRRPVPSRNRGGIIVPLKAHIGAAVPRGLAHDRRLAEDFGDAHRRRSSTTRQATRAGDHRLTHLVRVRQTNTKCDTA